MSRSAFAALGLVAGTLFTFACSAPASEDVDVNGGDALSAAECDTKADAAKTTSRDECVKRNTFDYASCTKPAYAAKAKYDADKASAREIVANIVQEVTGACKGNVASLSCNQILTSVGSDFAAARSASEGSGDSTLCAAARQERLDRCETDASADLRERLGTDDDFVKLVDQGPAQWLTFTKAVGSCWIDKASAIAGAATCTTVAAARSKSAYLACRHECPTVEASACTPAAYKDRPGAECGAYAPVKTALGLFCESGSECRRTSVCDQYDAFVAKTKGLSCVDANGKTGVLTAQVTTADQGGHQVPEGTTTACVVPEDE